jgi:serine/threonine protein kinase
MITPEIINAVVDCRYDPSTIIYERDEWANLVYCFGVVMYELLHGILPHDDPDHPCIPLASPRENNPELPPGLDSRQIRLKYERRERVLNSPPMIEEEVSKDFIDVLEAIFIKEPEERPTITELATFPWFQRWYMDCGITFKRPGRISRPIQGESNE